jgi:uncharacterized protein YcaQ
MTGPAAAPAARDVISRREARLIALGAQGFGRPRSAKRITAADILAMIDRLGVLQLDSVNVFCRSHYLPLYSRLGRYDRAELDRLAAHTDGEICRQLIEYWGHEASLLPLKLYPLLRWRMERADLEAWKPVIELARDRPDLIDQTLALVTDSGPIHASATAAPRTAWRPGDMWNWHDGKTALEYLFYAGRVAAARRVNFERIYDLPQRVLPQDLLAGPMIGEADAQRQLVRVAAAALGIASEPDLGDYFRLTRSDSRIRVAELVAAGELIAVDVEGWSAPGYLWPAAARPPQIAARALLSPFDSLIWTRERAERLFEFRYHVEIYTPAAKRTYGYYVLPFLLGDALVARVDLKSDRKQRRLLVQGAFAEPQVKLNEVASELAAELSDVADWLGLDGVDILPHGDLAPALAGAL